MAGVKDVLIALLAYSLIASIWMINEPAQPGTRDVILDDSWGYLLERYQPQRIRVSHGTLYQTTVLHSMGKQNKQYCRIYVNHSTPNLFQYTKIQNNLIFLCNLLLCGDIHPCPDPISRQPKYPCFMCDKGVRKNSKAISCDICDEWTHIKCCGIILTMYNEAVQSEGSIPYVCNKCAIRSVASPDSMDISNLFQSDGCDIDTAQHAERDTNMVAPSDQVYLNDENNFKCLQTKDLNFLHLNARSLLPKLDEMKILISKTNAAVIEVTETWLDDSIEDAEVELLGYVIYRRDRNRNGGGVCYFVRNDLAFNPRPDLNVNYLEAAWIEILLPKMLPILTDVCYRPPNQNNFYELLKQSCKEINDFAKN